MMSELYIGVMSGTSLDGVDVSLVEVDSNSIKILHKYEYEFDTYLKQEVLRVINNPISLRDIGTLDVKLAKMYAKCIDEFVDRFALDKNTIQAIGFHGQTLWHEPSSDDAFSIQLGSGSYVASLCGMRVVCDFRNKDIANGGEGAPLAPAFHQFLFGVDDGSMCVANIGGIANISYLATPLIGYDTGVGNLLMDSWIYKHKALRYDKDGLWAKEGRVDYALLDILMDDEYIKQSYPKSTGKERFNLEWLESKLKALSKDIKPCDVQRTLLEFTSLSLSNEVLKFNPDVLMLCGGGANNPLLVESISALIPNIQVATMQDSDAIESMMMGWLAHQRLHYIPIKLSSITGSSKDSVLGCVYV